MSKIIQCKDCGEHSDSNVKQCSKCGMQNKRNYIKYILGVLMVIIIAACFAAVIKINSIKNEKVSDNKEIASTSTKNTDAKASEISDNSSAENDEKDSKNQDTKITYENFLNIKVGESYDEVVELLGEGNEISSNEAEGVKTTIYDWKQSGVCDINITIQNNIVTEKSQLGLKSMDAQITLDKYNKVQQGISYDELMNILGEGQLLSQSKASDTEAVIYEYINKDESSAAFSFSEGKLIGKMKYNLE